MTLCLIRSRLMVLRPENRIRREEYVAAGSLHTAREPAMKAIAFTILLSVICFASSGAAAFSHGEPPILRNARNQFVILRPLKPAPTTIILADDGDAIELRRFRGKVILLNLWATWCAPCVRELPALDRLRVLLGNEDLEIVALSVDDSDIEKPVSFVRELGLTNLPVYLDYEEFAVRRFPLYGLPVSYLIDRDGLVVGYIVGAVEWDSPAAVDFLNYHIQYRKPAPSG